MVRFDALAAAFNQDTEPDNLAAAALDALEWLAFFERDGPLLRMSRLPDAGRIENQARLSACVTRLSEYLQASCRVP